MAKILIPPGVELPEIEPPAPNPFIPAGGTPPPRVIYSNIVPPIRKPDSK